MLIGSYKRRLRNGKVLVPQSFAVEYQSNVVARASYEVPCVDMYPSHLFEQLFTELSINIPADQSDDLISTIFADAWPLEISASRRLTMPESLINRASLADSVTMLVVGRVTHFVDSRVWDRVRTGAWEEFAEFLKKLCLPGSMLAPTPCPETADLSVIINDLERKKLSPRHLEEVVAEIFVSERVGVVELTQPSKDDGIDLVVYVPKNNGGTKVLYIQCKSGRIQINDVRELIGVVARDGVNAGLLVGLGPITAGAISETFVSKIDVQVVRLKLLATWIEQQMVRTRAAVGLFRL